jgi:hypothetical protein
MISPLNSTLVMTSQLLKSLKANHLKEGLQEAHQEDHHHK